MRIGLSGAMGMSGQAFVEDFLAGLAAWRLCHKQLLHFLLS
jgi:hypothetical protein